MAESLRIVLEIDDKGTAVVNRFGTQTSNTFSRLEKRSSASINVITRLTQGATSAIGKMGAALTLAAKASGIVGGAIGATGLAIFALTKKVANSQATIQEMSRTVGVTTETLSALKFAAEQESVSFTTLTTALTSAQRRISEAANGNKEFAESFDRLGVKLRDSTGKLRSVETLLPQLANSISQVKDESERTQLAFDVFGRSGTALLPVLDKGAAGLQAYTDRAKELGIVVSQDAANASKDFTGNLLDLQRSISGLTRNIANELIPIFAPLLKQIADLITGFRSSADNSKFFARAFVSSMRTAVDIIQVFGEAWAIVNKIFNNLVGGILLGISKIVNGLASLINAAAKAADFLKLKGTAESFRKASESVKSLSKDVELFSDAAFDTAKEWQASRDKIKQSMNAIDVAIVEASKSGTKGIAGLIENGTEKLVQGVNNAKESVLDLNKAFTVTTDTINATGVKIREFATGITTDMDDLSSQIKANFESSANQAIKQFMRIESSGKFTAGDLFNIFKRTYWDKVLVAGEDSVDKYQDLFDRLKKQAQDAGQSMARSLRPVSDELTRINDRSTRIVGQFTAFGSRSGGLFRDLEDQARAAGNASQRASRSGLSKTFGFRDFIIEQSVKAQNEIAKKLLSEDVSQQELLGRINIPSGFERFFTAFRLPNLAIPTRFQENAQHGRFRTRRGEAIFPGDDEMLLPRREADMVRLAMAGGGGGVSVTIGDVNVVAPSGVSRSDARRFGEQLSEEVVGQINEAIRLKKIRTN